MDIKNLRGLVEAYQQVNAPQEVSESVKGADPEMRKAAAAERKAGDRPLPAKEGEKFAKFKASQISYIDKKTKGKYMHGMTREDIDIFDTVLQFLQSEGIVESLEQAEWMMANLLDKEAIDIIVEAACECEDDDEEDEKEMKKGKKSKKEEEDEDEEEELDEALTGERYKKVIKKPGGMAYSRMVSANPSKRATRGGRGGESDFGAGDRGSGNKAARRAGTYQKDDL